MERKEVDKSMNHPEHTFWNRIRDKMPGHAVRIENTAGVGIPDVNVCCRGVEIWFELKVWTEGVGILLRKEQWAWMNRRRTVDGQVWVLCWVEKSDMVIAMPVWLIKVEAYGTQCKYVKIANCDAVNAHTMLRKDFACFLKTIVFPKSLT